MSSTECILENANIKSNGDDEPYPFAKNQNININDKFAVIDKFGVYHTSNRRNKQQIKKYTKPNQHPLQCPHNCKVRTSSFVIDNAYGIREHSLFGVLSSTISYISETPRNIIGAMHGLFELSDCFYETSSPQSHSEHKNLYM